MVQWTGKADPELPQQERRFDRRVGVPRVELGHAEVEGRRSMELVRAGLGEYLDPAYAQRVVLRREWILIDAYLPDGFLGRHLAGTESVDVERSAVRPGGGSGKGLKIRREVIRIVRQRIELRAAKHQRTRIACGLDRN